MRLCHSKGASCCWPSCRRSVQRPAQCHWAGKSRADGAQMVDIPMAGGQRRAASGPRVSAVTPPAVVIDSTATLDRTRDQLVSRRSMAGPRSPARAPVRHQQPKQLCCSPVDERALASAVIANNHYRHLLPRLQELHAQHGVLRDRLQAIKRCLVGACRQQGRNACGGTSDSADSDRGGSSAKICALLSP